MHVDFCLAAACDAVKDVGFACFIASDNFNCLFLFRRQRQRCIPLHAWQDVRCPYRTLGPACQARRTEAAHEVAAEAFFLPVRYRRFALLFQSRQQRLLTAAAVQDVFVVVRSKGEPVFHFIFYPVPITYMTDKDFIFQGLFDGSVPEFAPQCPFLYLSPLGDIGLELRLLRPLRRRQS